MWTEARRAAIAGILCAAALLAQDRPLSNGSVNIKLPADSPLALMSMSTGDSHASARGAALVLDLHMSLTLQNISGSRVRGLTLPVVSQEVTLGGRSSVSLLGLNVGPREVFPVHIDMQLMRPTQAAAGTLVDVNLDGVLFEDLSFYGPDRLNSRRTMTAWEVQAQRDREYYKRVLAQGGPEGLRRAVLDSMARAAARPRPTVQTRRRRAPMPPPRVRGRTRHPPHRMPPCSRCRPARRGSSDRRACPADRPASAPGHRPGRGASSRAPTRQASGPC
jgi:hypothetical protein